VARKSLTAFGKKRLSREVMRIFFHPEQALHDPAREMHNGAFVPYREHSGRTRSVLAALGAVETPGEDGGYNAAIADIHAPDYLDFLANAHRRWLEAGRGGDALPYVWPVGARRSGRFDRIDALLGRYSFDATTPITGTTWAAARAAAISAIAAADVVAGGDRNAFAVCRPPGHHSGADYFGGYCYLNNAAIAAQRLRNAGFPRVAILDVDYHHGNGTQDIFWTRGDVFYASIHANPETDYPFYWGHADEIGAGPGEGATLNLPLAGGTTVDGYRRALNTALDAVARYTPSVLVVSFGADTFTDDPICSFLLGRHDFSRIARDIADCGWRSVIVLEGGYAVDELGNNVAEFLSAFG
jgi:acetoin utilization deacetylase AcuC-like enzyme